MRLFTFLALILNLSSIVLAKAPVHRHHESHHHGSAEVHIAIEDLKGKIEFKAAAEGVLGFEHLPKSKDEKSKLAAIYSQFENEISKMISFDKSLSCIYIKDKIQLQTEDQNAEKSSRKHKGEHADFFASYDIKCNKTPIGSTLLVDFTSFSGLKDIDISILSGEIQKSIEAKSKPVSIELKP